MSTEDLEIQTIAKEISLFSLTLKQVGLLMESPDSIASQSAIDTAGKFSSQSRMIFTEIKEMEEVSQTRDEQGHLRSVTVARRVRWCSKKHKVQYLLAQLESLKLSLSIMLQVFQLGKYIAETWYVIHLADGKSNLILFIVNHHQDRLQNSKTCYRKEQRYRTWWWYGIGRW